MESYEDFRLLVADGPGGPQVRVLDSPAGQAARAPFECSVSERDLDRLARVVQWSAAATPDPGRRDLRPAGAFESDSVLADVGERLFRCLFAGEVRDRFLESRQLAPRGLRIRLQLDLRTGPASGGAGGEDRVGLHRLPWELLREPGEGHRRPLALRRATPVVRYLDVEGRAALPATPEVLGVLAVAPEPAGVPRLDLEREARELRDALGGRRDVAFRVLEPPTLEGLIEALRGGDVHVLHFMGHGELDPGTGDGALVLEDEAGRPRSLPARALVEQLGDFLSPLRLVFLNACRTAEAAAGAPWTGVATALVRAGVPAVLAMQLPVTDRAAVTFAGSVYRRLARGETVDRAATEGRLALRREIDGTPEWATPALFLRVPDGRVFATPARAEPTGTGEGRARRPGGAGRRPPRPAWVAAGLAAFALGALVVLRGGAPAGDPGSLPGSGPPGGAETVEEPAGTPLEASAPSEPAREETAAGGGAEGPGSPAGSGERAAGGGPSLPPPPATVPESTEPETPERSRLAGSAEAPERTEGAGGPGAPGTVDPSGSTLLELAFGDSAYVREIRAHVTVDSVTVQGTELVRVTVSPERAQTQVRSGFSGSTLRFPAGEEALSVHVLSLDRATGRVRLRIRRLGL